MRRVQRKGFGVLRFLFNLIFVILLARLATSLVRLLRGGSRREPAGPPPPLGGKPRRAADVLGEDIVDAEFEETARKREP